MESRGPRSLAFLAQKACIKYLKRINDIGDCPYDLIRPVLLKLENPDQLHQLEINSPQLIGLDGELWLQLIKRDIPDWESKQHQPKDPKNWWKLYKRLKDQIQRDREQGAEKLKAALDSIKDEREQNLAKVVSRKDLPKEPLNNRAKTSYSHSSSKTGSKPGHKLSLLEKIRKEARDARLARLNRPASQLVNKPTEIKQAPRGLVEDYKRSIQQKCSTSVAVRPPPAPRIPKPPLALTRQEKPGVDKSFQEREDRLRALTGGRLNRATTALESSSKVTDHQPKRSTISQTMSNPRPSLPQNDGVDEENVEDTQPAKKNSGITSKPMRVVNSPPKQGIGTPPLSRFGSPGAPPKRKAEPSIFMTAKKPKLAR